MPDSTSATVGFKTTSYQSWVDVTNIIIFISSNQCGSYQEPIILHSAPIIQLAVDQTNPLDLRCLIPRISHPRQQHLTWCLVLYDVAVYGTPQGRVAAPAPESPALTVEAEPERCGKGHR